jgi:hypothetical protein
MLVPHDDVPEFPEKTSLQRFGKKIRKHLFGWTVLHVDVFDVESVLDEKVSDVDMS